MSEFENVTAETVVSLIDEINAEVQKLMLELDGQTLGAGFAEALNHYNYFKNLFEQKSEHSEHEIFSHAATIVSHANLIAIQSLPPTKSGDQSTMRRIANLANSLSEALAARKTTFDASVLIQKYGQSKKSMPGLSDAKTIESRSATMEELDILKNFNKDAEFNRRVAELNATLDSLESAVKGKLTQVDKLYTETEKDLDLKKTAIDNQLGTLTSATMAKDYAEFADIEKGIANEYRKYSLWAMFGVAIVVAFTLWQTAKGEFTIPEAVLRLSFILIISAPAVYLTRESAKHRAQENAHRQTNLDLRAITPYIASLSPTEQSQIKTQIALRLFGSRNQPVSESNQTPININDLVLKLLDKVDLSPKSDHEKKEN